jgi:glycosyltransferase involved in cell wall biosynthesis
MTTQAADSNSHHQTVDSSSPTLSVTVLNYNYGRYLPQCLDSILRQTFVDFELILVNDCSTDNSLEVIEPYLANPRVRLVNHTKNQGYIASLLEGSRLSQGKYITVISADDYCVSDRAFENLLRPMEADDSVAFAYSTYGYYFDDGTRKWLGRLHPTSFVRSGVEEYRDLLLSGNHIMHSGVIIRATAYEAVGGYDPLLTYACDTKMWLMLCGHGKVAFCTDELYAYRWHGSNMSGSKRGLRDGLRETLDALKTSFAVMGESPEITKDLYVRAIKRNLTGFAEGGVFAGDLRGGWYVFWCAARIHPILTIFQIKTLTMIARSLLGARGYGSIRSVLRRQHGPVITT